MNNGKFGQNYHLFCPLTTNSTTVRILELYSQKKLAMIVSLFPWGDSMSESSDIENLLEKDKSTAKTQQNSTYDT
jgi:hypothetical protein